MCTCQLLLTLPFHCCLCILQRAACLMCITTAAWLIIPFSWSGKVNPGCSRGNTSKQWTYLKNLFKVLRSTHILHEILSYWMKLNCDFICYKYKQGKISRKYPEMNHSHPHCRLCEAVFKRQSMTPCKCLHHDLYNLFKHFNKVIFENRSSFFALSIERWAILTPTGDAITQSNFYHWHKAHWLFVTWLIPAALK